MRIDSDLWIARRIRYAVCLLIFGGLATPVVGTGSTDLLRMPAIDTEIEQLQSEGHFPGIAVAVMRHGKPVHIGTYGMADLGHEVPVTTRTVFELASLTKQMTALAVMSLVEQGRMDLDMKLSRWIEDAPEAWAGITAGHLLGHTAGLAHHFEQTVNGVHLLEYTRQEMLASAMATPMVAEPGADWNYSDQGYFLLGLVIEAVTGQSYAEHMRSAFFERLGMDQTHLLDQRRIVPGLAQGYAWNDGELQRNRRVWQFALTSHFGVMSSLQDMMRWEAALSDPERISRGAMHATWKIQRTFGTGDSCDTWGYARGWQVVARDDQRILSHGGYSGTAYVRAVDSGLSVIVLTNREDSEGALSPQALAWAAAHAVDPDIPADGFRCWE